MFKELFEKELNEAPSADIMLKSLTKKLDKAKIQYKVESKVNYKVVKVQKYTISVGGTFAGKYTVLENIGSNVNELESYEWNNILKLIGSLNL